MDSSTSSTVDLELQRHRTCRLAGRKLGRSRRNAQLQVNPSSSARKPPSLPNFTSCPEPPSSPCWGRPPSRSAPSSSCTSSSAQRKPYAALSSLLFLIQNYFTTPAPADSASCPGNAPRCHPRHRAATAETRATRAAARFRHAESSRGRVQEGADDEEHTVRDGRFAWQD